MICSPFNKIQTNCFQSEIYVAYCVCVPECSVVVVVFPHAVIFFGFILPGHTNSDDESAYYSEVGTFQKQNLKNETQATGKSNNNSHYYSSRPVADAHFYHMIEVDQNQPPPALPATGPPPGMVAGQVYHTLEDKNVYAISPNNQNR